MRRGEVWWCNFSRPAGPRPVVLLSRDSAYAVRNAVTVAPVTRTIRNIPVEVLLDKREGLPSRCVVNVDNLTTVPKSLLKKRIATLPDAKIRQIEEAIRFALDMQ